MAAGDIPRATGRLSVQSNGSGSITCGDGHGRRHRRGAHGRLRFGRRFEHREQHLEDADADNKQDREREPAHRPGGDLRRDDHPHRESDRHGDRLNDADESDHDRRDDYQWRNRDGRLRHHDEDLDLEDEDLDL
jgi:hypothetical protein